MCSSLTTGMKNESLILASSPTSTKPVRITFPEIVAHGEEVRHGANGAGASATKNENHNHLVPRTDMYDPMPDVHIHKINRSELEVN
jgi:hypothetical protein